MIFRLSFFITILVFLVSCNSSESEAKARHEVMIKTYNSSALSYMPDKSIATLGNPKAKTILDVVFDPLCDDCRFFERTINEFIKDEKYNKRIYIRFHIVPLWPKIKDDQYALMLHLEMKKLGLYNKFRILVVDNDPPTYKDMLAIAEDISKKTITTDYLEKTYSKDFQQLKNFAEKTLVVNHTPDVYVNNRELGMMVPQKSDLKMLIEYIESTK